MYTRYHLDLRPPKETADGEQEAELGHAADAIASWAGGTVRNTVQCYNSEGNDFAAIVVRTADCDGPEGFEAQVLDADDRVIGYRKFATDD